jgi:hypothetical protein
VPSWDGQAPRAPLPLQGVTPPGMTCPVTWEGIALPSSLLWTHAPVPNPPSASAFRLVQRVFAGCCQSLLGVGPSRRYLCESFPTCLDPYPGCSSGALARFFPPDFGLPRVRTGAALHFCSVQRLQYGARLRGSSHSLRFRPAGLLATQVAPTAVLPPVALPRPVSPRFRFGASLGESLGFRPGQPWLFHLNNSWFVTSPSPRYACCPNRAIDSRGLSPHKIHGLVGCSPNGCG